MTKKLFLSNSQIDTYTDCQFKWYLQKVDKIRPDFLSSPLYLGKNLDSTIEKYLLGEISDYKQEYLNQIMSFEVNSEVKKLPEDLLSLRSGS